MLSAGAAPVTSGAGAPDPAAIPGIDVLPRDDAAFASGARAYRCLAHALTGPNPGTSEFSRQPAPGRVLPKQPGPGTSAASEVKGLA